MKQAELEISLSIDGIEQKTTGTVNVEYFNKSKRTKRCIGFWGGCWAGAVVGVFIPGLHFVLVPGLLILGPVLGYIELNKAGSIIGGSGSCPKCQAELKIEKTSLKWPIEELCTECRSNIIINRV